MIYMEKKYKKRVLFVGMPDMAIYCLNKLTENGINIVGVVPPCVSDSTYKLMMSVVKKHQLNAINYENSLTDEKFLQKIKELNADIGVVASYNKKLPKELLELTKDGFINLHPSKLPDYRGGNPYSHVIINGEKESAITLHYMDENYDTGDIISQFCFYLDENETMGTLFHRTNEMCASMLFEALDYYEENPFPRKPQPNVLNAKKAYSFSFEKGNVFIDWEKSALEIESFIRGLNPFIGAFTYYKDVLLRINSADAIQKKHKYAAGTVINTKNGLFVACGKDILEIEAVQFGALYSTTGKDFVNRAKIKKGEVFTRE